MIEPGAYFIVSAEGHPLKVQADGKVHAAHDRPDRHSQLYVHPYATDHARLTTADGRLVVQAGDDLLVVGDQTFDDNSWRFEPAHGSLVMGRKMKLSNPATGDRIRIPHGGGWIGDVGSYAKVLPHEPGAREGLTFLPWSEAGTYWRAARVEHGDLPARIEDLVGRVIGGGRTEDWWMGDRYHSLPDDHIRAWRESPWMADCNTAWISLCTTNRAEMRSIPMDGTRPENMARIQDKLALLYELGISPVLELLQQEFLTHVLRKDPVRVRDYMAILGETYVRGNTACLIAMPTREMTEHAVRLGRSQDEDVAILASYLATTEQACNDGQHVVHTGVHLRATEAPTVGLFRAGSYQLRHPLWLAYDHFYLDLSAPTRRERKSSTGGHEMHTFADVPAYYRYWDDQRAQAVPNWGGFVCFEFGIPDTVPVGNWGPGHSLDEVRRRGEIMRAANARADLAMGIRYTNG